MTAIIKTEFQKMKRTGGDRQPTEKQKFCKKKPDCV